MAEQTYSLKLKATLDTSEIQGKLNQLNNQASKAQSDSGSRGNDFLPNKLNNTLNVLNRTLSQLAQAINRLNGINSAQKVVASNNPFIYGGKKLYSNSEIRKNFPLFGKGSLFGGVTVENPGAVSPSFEKSYNKFTENASRNYFRDAAKGGVNFMTGSNNLYAYGDAFKKIGRSSIYTTALLGQKAVEGMSDSQIGSFSLGGLGYGYSQQDIGRAGVGILQGAAVGGMTGGPLGAIVGSGIGAATEAIEYFTRKAQEAADELGRMNQIVAESNQFIKDVNSYEEQKKTSEKLNSGNLETLNAFLNQLNSKRDTLQKAVDSEKREAMTGGVSANAKEDLAKLKETEATINAVRDAIERLNDAESKRLADIYKEADALAKMRENREFGISVSESTNVRNLENLLEMYGSKMDEATNVQDYQTAASRYDLVYGRLDQLDRQKQEEEEIRAQRAEKLDSLKPNKAMRLSYQNALENNDFGYLKSEMGVWQNMQQNTSSPETWQEAEGWLGMLKSGMLGQLQQQLQQLQSNAPKFGATTGMAALGGSVGEKTNYESRMEQYYSTMQTLVTEIRNLQQENGSTYK